MTSRLINWIEENEQDYYIESIKGITLKHSDSDDTFIIAGKFDNEPVKMVFCERTSREHSNELHLSYSQLKKFLENSHPISMDWVEVLDSTGEFRESSFSCFNKLTFSPMNAKHVTVTLNFDEHE